VHSGNICSRPIRIVHLVLHYMRRHSLFPNKFPATTPCLEYSYDSTMESLLLPLDVDLLQSSWVSTHTKDTEASEGLDSQFGTLVLESLVAVMEMESMDFPLVDSMETLVRELGMLEVEQVPVVQVEALELELVVLVEAPELVEALVVLATVLEQHY